ncbi:MAG: hypothetical protein O2816_08025 [Planctomycetota bacterium]|nr:hypothetical protein [Planctomycetota bacterium]
MPARALALMLFAACRATPPTWAPPPHHQWGIELGVHREALREVWFGGSFDTLRGEGRILECLRMYAVISQAFLEDSVVVGFVYGNTQDRQGELMHPDLEGLQVGIDAQRVLDLHGEPKRRQRYEGQAEAVEVWSYGLDRPRYLVQYHPLRDYPALMGLVVGLP